MKNLHDLRLGNDFLDMTPNAQAIEQKNKLDSSKLKTFMLSKDTIKKVKRQPTECG